MMITANDKQVRVFGVNIDSPNRNQVKIGNTISPADDPMNLAVHAEPVWSTINFQEYQNATEVGIPRKKAADRGLFDHHSDKYCALSWNHPKTCPKRTSTIPMYKFINVTTFLTVLLMI